MPRNKLSETEQGERERIGATIRQLREMRGYRPDQFANSLDISRSYLANIEAGRKPLTEVLLSRIATELGVAQIVICRRGYFEPAELREVVSA